MRNQTNKPIERRAVIAGLAGLTSVGALSASHAQSARLDEKTLATLKTTAVQTENLVIQISRFPPNAKGMPVSDFRGTGSQIARNGAANLQRVEPAERALYAIPLNYDIIEALSEAKISLVPTPDEAAMAMERIPEDARILDEKDPLWSILLDIILDTIGIRELASSIIKEKARLATLSALVDELKMAVKTRNTAQIARQCERIFGYLGTRSFRTVFISVVGPTAANRMLVSIAARLVPFIGWGLTVACFLLSVHRNWNKIEAHL